jgi:sialic acid synthase SpsE
MMTKLIAEIGINHNGSYLEAQRLINMASSTKCWGVKFQYRDLDNYFLNLSKSSELGKEIIDEEIKKNYLSNKQIITLASYAKKKNLKVGLSLFLKKDYIFFKNYKFDFFKIPSPVCHDYELIKFLNNKSKLIIISFGGKSFFEIKKIISDCSLNEKNTVLLHCISNYPVNEINSNLGFLDKLKNYYKDFKVGYSSHEKTILNSILCLTKNIDFIERHITLNKNGDGLDHTSSSDFDELKLFQMYNENFFNIYSKNQKIFPNQGEIINIQNLGTSYYANKDLKKGSFIKKIFLKKKQPCIGITDLDIEKYLTKKLSKNIKKNDPITKSAFTKQELNKSDIITLNKYNFSLPIRPRDYKNIYSNIPIKNYEMHLSYSDINNFKIEDFNKSFIGENYFTVHMPDYCDKNNIIDFFSPNMIIKKKSKALLMKTIEIANHIKKNNTKKIDIIISLSRLNNLINKYAYYDKVKKLVNDLKKQSINLLPQWLPVDAWYFGGNVKTRAFSNPKDLNYLKKINLKICLDTSHFILSCNYHKLDVLKYYINYKSIFKHYHLSDAKGTDGEGVLIGEGEMIKKGLMKKILKERQTVKVLETWQGHLDEQYKFKKDLKKIIKLLK